MGQQTSTPKITLQDRAIFQLKQQRDKLKQYQRKLNTIIERQNKLAKEAIVKKDTARAKVYLRSKKQQQTTITKTYEQLDNLETLIGTIEFKLIEKDVMYGLAQGNEVLKTLNSEMSVDKIDKVLDDLEEERLKVDEVLDMLGMGSGLSNGEEHEVDEELANLEAEVNGTNKVETGALQDIDMPAVPNTKPESKISGEEEGEKPVKSEPNEPIAA
ncbi:uncharacterized protein AC631_03599 [Debaryomyces fabryi]|uniref:Charged multivesicular body protein 6 n=1 Tax=Debaryomyces fabryi TaxID=58627 RepID=A0A0V1PWN4_9ASCO|nr:uncharacterized protein AC631_03599 [Debaryomyces fabryi]KSA00663.1 hypothetical protein AC631_03599 [Debaryomyces fabryi]CUM45930.1 unnamed protein product [Debaryomyces fabryi]